MGLNRTQIKALDRDQLQRLLLNAQTIDGTEAREVERLVLDELASRHKPKSKKVVKWEHSSDSLWEGYFAGRKVAIITKNANHSNAEKNVYYLSLDNIGVGYFERIETARRRVEDVISKSIGGGGSRG